MALSSIGGGAQNGDGNNAEVTLTSHSAPATATVTATLTAAQVTNGLLHASPATTAATYTLPTAALMDAYLVNAHAGSTFYFSVVNIDGSASGVITLAAGTGWTLAGLMTVVATAGTAQVFRARKTGEAAWVLSRYA